MNVYDCANELAKALKDSREFKALKEAKEVLAKDPEAMKMANEFMALNVELGVAKYQGQEPDKEKSEKANKLLGILQLNRDAVEYLQAMMRFEMLMNDINKSIGDVVKQVIGE